jgi:2-keto-4-pentenoate hydratase/2-oxohepta-3-ene-1,7-dioic acid hydratase in catechol pathway
VADFFIAAIEDADGATSAVVRDGEVFVVSGRPSVADLLNDWDTEVKRLGGELEGGRLEDPVPLDSIKLLTPVADPPNLYLVGGNYADHAREMQKLGPDVRCPRRRGTAGLPQAKAGSVRARRPDHHAARLRAA